jgi:hypothetical protein
MMAKIAKASAVSPSKAEITVAATSTMTMKSWNCRKKLSSGEGRDGFAKRLGPNLRARLAASLAVRPEAQSVPSSFKTAASGNWQY